MKNYRWLITLFILTASCKAQEGDSFIPKEVEIIEVKQDCICPIPHVTIDTTAIGLLREKDKEIHLLRVEIDALKEKLENIRNLQILDSILKAKTE